MKLTEIVIAQAVQPDLAARTRDEAIEELVRGLAETGAIAQEARDTLVHRVLDRERKGSTGFGKGVAVPHVKHELITKMSATIGLSKGGIDFRALDGQPVFCIFLLLSPADRPEEHLQAMEVIFKNLSKETFRHFLRQADTREDVATLLDEADNQQIAG